MTTVQKQSALTLLASIGIPLLIAVASMGAARQQLAEKEDASSHILDVARLGARMDLQQVRDSAQMAKVLDRLTDLACAQNPQRTYCRGTR